MSVSASSNARRSAEEAFPIDWRMSSKTALLAFSFQGPLTDPSTWGRGDELTEEADTEPKGLDKRRQEAKAKAAKMLTMGQANTAVEQRLEADRERRLAMQERLVAGTVGRVEEMGLLPEQEVQVSNDLI